MRVVASTSIGTKGMHGACTGWGGLITNDAQEERLNGALTVPEPSLQGDLPEPYQSLTRALIEPQRGVGCPHRR